MAEKTVPQAPVVIDTESRAVIEPTGVEVLRVGLLGALVGLFVPLLSWLIGKFFIQPVFCHSGDSLGLCSSGNLTPYYVATVIVTVVAVALLANWQVFRPLLIAVAAAAALWGLRKYLNDVANSNWVEYYGSSVLLYAVMYLLFYWLLRLRSFAVSVILTVVAVILVRWALLS